VDTTILLLRHGETDWSRERRILGSRDLGLNSDGLNQAQAAARALVGIDIGEIIAGPLLRTVQTAEVIAGLFDLEVARDPRLGEMHLGRWEGMPYDAAAVDPDYQRFMEDPAAVRLPGVEQLSDVRDRALASVSQALSDNPGGSNIVVVSHATIVRLLLCHFLGIELSGFHRLRVNPGAFSMLRFSDDRELPRILAINQLPSIAGVLEP
jgi:broad specificity phosphatase PhoE